MKSPAPRPVSAHVCFTDLLVALTVGVLALSLAESSQHQDARKRQQEGLPALLRQLILAEQALHHQETAVESLLAAPPTATPPPDPALAAAPTAPGSQR